MRRHQRVLVPEGRTIRVEASQPGLEGVVSVIGLGGMFIRARDSHPCGTVLQFRLTDPSVSFESECTVRHVATNGLGVEFTQLTPENEQKLKDLLLRLKGWSSAASD